MKNLVSSFELRRRRLLRTEAARLLNRLTVPVAGRRVKVLESAAALNVLLDVLRKSPAWPEAQRLLRTRQRRSAPFNPGGRS